MKTTEITEKVSSHFDGKSCWEPRTASAHPNFRIKRGSDGKKLALHWRGEKITKKCPLGSWARNQMGNVNLVVFKLNEA